MQNFHENHYRDIWEFSQINPYDHMEILTYSSNVSPWNFSALLPCGVNLWAHSETILAQFIYSTASLNNKYKNTQCSFICGYLDRGSLFHCSMQNSDLCSLKSQNQNQQRFDKQACDVQNIKKRSIFVKFASFTC